MNHFIKVVLKGILFVVIWIVVWNLFEFIWKTWVTGGQYQFFEAEHFLYPLGLGALVYLLLCVPGFFKKKNK